MTDNERLLRKMFECHRKNGEFIISWLKNDFINEKVITVPEGVTVIGDRFMFNSHYDTETEVMTVCNVEAVILPEGVKEISGHAFDGLSRLKKIYIPKTVEVIGDEAFNYCGGLTIYCEDKPRKGWIDKEPEMELREAQGRTVFYEEIRFHNNWNPLRLPVKTNVPREEFLKIIEEEYGNG